MNRNHSIKVFRTSATDELSVENLSKRTYLQAEKMNLKTHFCKDNIRTVM